MEKLNITYSPSNSFQTPAQAPASTWTALYDISFEHSDNDIYSTPPLAGLEKTICIKKNSFNKKVLSTPSSIDTRFSQCPSTPKTKIKTINQHFVNEQKTIKPIVGFASGIVVGALSAIACMMRFFK